MLPMVLVNDKFLFRVMYFPITKQQKNRSILETQVGVHSFISIPVLGHLGALDNIKQLVNYSLNERILRIDLTKNDDIDEFIGVGDLLYLRENHAENKRESYLLKQEILREVNNILQSRGGVTEIKYDNSQIRICYLNKDREIKPYENGFLCANYLLEFIFADGTKKHYEFELLEKFSDWLIGPEFTYQKITGNSLKDVYYQKIKGN